MYLVNLLFFLFMFGIILNVFISVQSFIGITRKIENLGESCFPLWVVSLDFKISDNFPLFPETMCYPLRFTNRPKNNSEKYLFLLWSRYILG